MNAQGPLKVGYKVIGCMSRIGIGRSHGSSMSSLLRYFQADFQSGALVSIHPYSGGGFLFPHPHTSVCCHLCPGDSCFDWGQPSRIPFPSFLRLWEPFNVFVFLSHLPFSSEFSVQFHSQFLNRVVYFFLLVDFLSPLFTMDNNLLSEKPILWTIYSHHNSHYY